MTDRTIRHTAERILSGTASVIAIKEHCDAWNRAPDARLFHDEPPMIGTPQSPSWIDAWLAGAAEYEAYLIGVPAPDWALEPRRFLRTPFIPGGPNTRRYALIETPFAWRRRMVFGGRTMIEAGTRSLEEAPEIHPSGLNR